MDITIIIMLFKQPQNLQKINKMQTHHNIPNTFTDTMVLAIFICLFITPSHTFKTFGMNKPHFLFHLGDRRPISTNIGWGYWSGSQPLRLKYENTDNNIYADMVIHDGQNIFQQNVQDTRANTTSSLKFILQNNAWQSQIQMENRGNQTVTWFMYFSVQNNDYKLVDHQKFTSYIYLKPQFAQQTQPLKNQLNINMLSLLYPNQTFSMKTNKYQIQSEESQQKQIDDKQILQKNQLKLFGISANISQTHTIHHISQTFKQIIRISKGQQKLAQINDKTDKRQAAEKQKDKKFIQWQKKQIQFIKQDKWEQKSYVVLYVYGTLKIGEKNKVYLTNTTKISNKNFDQLFEKRTKQLQQLYSTNIKDQQKVTFVKHVISNLYGGLTFYYGRLYTQNSLTVHKQDYSFTFTPSRLIFPRSFLWDDGFHQSVIVHYNPEIVLDILTNWVNKIDIFGWIGRQQIRGSQISSMMPDARFVFQDWFQMNPPTLMMSLISLIEKSHTNPILQQNLQFFLRNSYRKLQSWYRYFKNTQSHQSLQYEQSLNSTDRFYRWHCKDQCSKGNFMGSGLDDYPRRTQQQQIAKQHVDLVSWLYMFAKSLQKVGSFMEDNVDKQIRMMKQINRNNDQRITNKYTRRVKYYRKQAQQYLHQLYESFYDKQDSLFKDIVVARSDLFIQKFVNKIGYINLFPFFTGMLTQQSVKYSDYFMKYSQTRVKSIQAILKIMSNQNLLFSKDGLRSLSFSDPLYGTDDNYWRGAVWLPINYMVLRACKLYYWHDNQVGQQVQQFYTKLRERLINSVYNTYKDTGYLFQNYYEGRGHRGFPFYGWTATIVNIITEQY